MCVYETGFSFFRFPPPVPVAHSKPQEVRPLAVETGGAAVLITPDGRGQSASEAGGP